MKPVKIIRILAMSHLILNETIQRFYSRIHILVEISIDHSLFCRWKNKDIRLSVLLTRFFSQFEI